MAEAYHLPHPKRSTLRVYKPLYKLSANMPPMVQHSPQKLSNQTQNLSKNCFSSKIKQKVNCPTAKSQFNLCASKNVFVFAKMQFPISTARFTRNKEIYRRQVTEQVFCSNQTTARPFYRNMVRSKSSKREKTGPETRVSTSQINRKLYIKPQPWEMKGQGHDFQSLF